MKLAIVTTHPIQYYAPWFKYLADFMDLHVFYMHQENASERSKGGFGVEHEWDIDLLSGYNYTFLKNVAKEPSVNSFKGCDTPEIYKIIKEGHFDTVLVLGWYVKAFWQTIIACKRYKVPILVRGDSKLQEEQPFLKKIIKRIVYPVMLKVFNGFLYVGENNKNYLKHYNVDESKLFFCPHFIDQDFFKNEAHKYDKKVSREKLGIEKDAIVLLFVGKLIEEKRPIDILEAMNEIYTKHKNVETVFVGSGKLEVDLITYCKKNPHLKVHFAGFKNQTKLPEYYNLATLLVLPSSSETWGLVINEAFACLTPVVVSDRVGCMPDMVEKGLTGDVFICCDYLNLANTIITFISKMNVQDTKEKIEKVNKVYSKEYATDALIKAMKEVSYGK